MSDTTTTVRLPATGAEVPAALAEYRVTGLKSWNGWDGVGYEATVRKGSKIVGHIYDEGNGGEVRFRGQTVEAEREFNLALYGPPSDGPVEIVPLDPEIFADDEKWAAHFAATPEGQVQALITEYEVVKALNKAVKAGKLVFRLPEDPSDAWRELRPADPAVWLATLNNKFPSAIVWRDGEWRAL